MYSAHVQLLCLHVYYISQRRGTGDEKQTGSLLSADLLPNGTGGDRHIRTFYLEIIRLI